MNERDGYEEDQIIRWTVDSETGLKISEQIMRFDKTLHCDHQAAYREFHHLSGHVLLERWYQNGKCHRLALHQPSETLWSTNTGFVIRKSYMQYNNIHRDDHKPARVFYHEDTGTVKREEFWQHNSLHRDHSLPAILEYDDYGNIIHREFYNKGIKISGTQHKPTL